VSRTRCGAKCRSAEPGPTNPGTLDIEQFTRRLRLWTPDQQRTTPQGRRHSASKTRVNALKALHPGNAAKAELPYPYPG